MAALGLAAASAAQRAVRSGSRWHQASRCMAQWSACSRAVAGKPRHVSSSTAAFNEAHVHDAGKQVAVDIDGATHGFHARWLLLNCRAFFQPATGQRLIEIQELPKDPRVSSCVASTTPEGKDVVELQWEHGHTSTFDTAWLKQHAYDRAVVEAQSLARRPPALDRDVELPEMEFDELMSSEEAVWKWLRQLNLYGVSIVRNAPIAHNERDTYNSVRSVAGRVAGIQRTIYGEVFSVKVEKQPINVAYTSAMLGHHVDLSYYESPPGLQLLHCVRFDEDIQGGESTFFDAFAAAELLRKQDPASFETLCRVPVTLQKVHKDRDYPVHMVYQRPHFELNALGEIISLHWSPPFEGPLHVPHDEVDAYFDAYRAFADLVTHDGEQFLKKIRMKPGDMSVFNNRRVLHGRVKFTSTAAPGSRELLGAYVNIDEYLSRYQLLCDKFGGADDVRRVFNGDHR